MNLWCSGTWRCFPQVVFFLLRGYFSTDCRTSAHAPQNHGRVHIPTWRSENHSEKETPHIRREIKLPVSTLRWGLDTSSRYLICWHWKPISQVMRHPQPREWRPQAQHGGCWVALGILVWLIYRNHPLCGDKLRRGWFLYVLWRLGGGGAGGCRKLCRGLVFSSRVLAW